VKILIVKPVASTERAGNDVTAGRWARLLRELDHEVAIASEFDAQPCDTLIALHARKSADVALRFRRTRPGGLLIVALTGTDVYGDIADDEEVQRVLQAADGIVELQPLARQELAEDLHPKVRTILQSSEPVPARGTPRNDRFDVCTIGHLREVKDPFRAAEAARLLPDSSLVHITQVGRALEPSFENRAREEELRNPRYTWRGECSWEETGRILTSCQLIVLSSRSEGGANVISEALINDVPVLSSRIPGSVGLLGEGYPGYFEYGDTEALAALLLRSETEPAFLEGLRSCCRFLAPSFDPERERQAWLELLQTR
jgi:putative glycosyltransferase (TIGR04348 family)